MTEGADTEPIIRQLRVISKILIVTNASAIKAELERIASTDDRRRWWVLFDGTRTISDVEKLTRKTARGIRFFVRDAANAGFMETPPRAPPYRAIDYVPDGWADLVDPLLVDGQAIVPAISVTPDPPIGPSRDVLPAAQSGEEKSG